MRTGYNEKLYRRTEQFLLLRLTVTLLLLGFVCLFVRFIYALCLCSNFYISMLTVRQHAATGLRLTYHIR